MNETLEQMAQAIFKDWFVDFGPIRRKQEGASNPIAIMGGLVQNATRAAELAALFPDVLGGDCLPPKWGKLTLKELARRSGGTIRTGPFGSQLHQSDYSPVGIPVVMPANLTSGEIKEDGIARVSPVIAKRLGEHAMQEGDIVYGRRGDIGRKALVSADETGWLCGTGCLRISIRSQTCPPLYIFHHLDRPESREWIAARAVGATMPNLNTGILGEVEILNPTPELAAAFLDLVMPLFQKSRVNLRENKCLAETRDYLLPKLMSGEVRVSHATNLMVEENDEISV